MEDGKTEGPAADDGLAASQETTAQEDAAADVTGETGAQDGQEQGGENETASETASADPLLIDQCVAAFARLGIETKSDDPPQPQDLIAGLNAAADNIERLTAELATVSEERDALASKLEAAETEPKATKGKRGSAVRAINAGKVVDLAEAKLGELVLPEGAGASEKLLAAIRAAETVQVAFSNGKNEIAALDPVDIAGDAWRVTIVGVQLTLPELILHGPGFGGEAIPLSGYGLLLNGKLVAYRDRGEQLSIGAGARMNVGPDIVF